MDRLNELLDALCDIQDTITHLNESAGVDWSVHVAEREREKRSSIRAEIVALFEQAKKDERERCIEILMGTKFRGPYPDEGGECYYPIRETTRWYLAKAIREASDDRDES